MEYIRSIPFIKRDCLHLPEDYKFGCEVEVNNIPTFLADEICYSLNWYILDEYFATTQDDRTVDAELVTRILEDTKADWDKFTLLLETLKENGAQITGRASGHIHYNSAMIDTKEKLSNLIKILCVFEPIIYRMGLGVTSDLASFHYCQIYGDQTLTRVMNPKDVDEFIGALEQKYLTRADFCRAYIRFIHSEVYYRPIFNFRKYNIERFTDQDTLDKAVKERLQSIPYNDGEIISGLFYLEAKASNNLEVRCFNGSLDTRIWQNNYDVIARILYAVLQDKVDMKRIDELFKNYRRQRYGFYKEIDSGEITAVEHLKDASGYNNFLQSYIACNQDLVNLFVDTFYNLGLGNEELDKLLFLKQYYKLFNEEDIASLKLK